MGNVITIGPYDDPIFTATDTELRSVSMVSTVDLVAAELAIDTLTAIVDDPYADDDVQVIAGTDFDYIQTADDYIIATNWTHQNVRLAPYGSPVRYYKDGQLVRKAYVQSVDRIGETTYQVNAISVIGLLDTQIHKGGLYQGTPFTTLLADILGADIDYTIGPELNSLTVYGWLPYDSKRNNLHSLLFASGVSVRRDSNADMYFCFLNNNSPITVPSDRIYIGGSVDYSSPASSVEVTEHSFMALTSDETVTEYDNTDGSETASNTLLVFQNAPLHNLQTTGTLTISSYGVNWAVISGTGTLTGQKYTHSTRVLTKVAPGASDQLENVVSVQNCTLVTVVNSENVSDRILSYYSSKKTVNTGLVIENEQAGDMIVAIDPYNETITGYISTMDAVVSSFVQGNCQVITDYTPSGGGNNFTTSHLYTGTGTIDLATLIAGKDNDLVQVILISGGHGGYSGSNGTDGTRGSQGPSIVYGEPGEGGEGGAPGEGGLVFVKTLHVNELAQTTVSYSCGAGGLSDTAGGATTFGSLTSADGAITANGIADIFSGTAYALAGTQYGEPGGRGSGPQEAGPDVSYNGSTWHAGAKGSNVTGEATGGWGGGAAVGSDGADGENAQSYPGGASSGSGGDGADGAAGADATQYGCGGNGGHGGGGGGVGGAWLDSGNWWNPDYNGTGGTGGSGGQGGPGLIIIYS